MPPLMNKDTVSQELQDPMRQKIAAMTPGQRKARLAELDTMEKQLSPVGMVSSGNRLQNIIGDVSDVFLQSGGIKPPERKMSDINDFIMKERVKRAIEGDPLEKFKAEQDYRTGLERKTREESIKQFGDRGMRPKGITAGGDITYEAIPTDAELQEEEDRKARIVENRERIKQQTKTKEILSEASLMTKDVNGLLNTFKKIPQRSRGPIQGRTVGALSAFFQINKDLAVYEDTKDFFLSNIARRFGGERGVLTDKDIERVGKWLPMRRDSDEVAKEKTSRIQNFLNERIKSYKSRAGQTPIESGQTETGFKIISVRPSGSQ